MRVETQSKASPKEDLISSLRLVIHEASILTPANAFRPRQEAAFHLPWMCLFGQLVAKKNVPADH